MIETQATVTALEGRYALVEASQGGCGRCREPGGCGGHNAVQIFCQEPRRFRALNPVGAQVGEKVVIGVADGVISRAVLILYVLPLALVVMGAVIGGMLGAGGNRDVMAAFFAMGGGGLAWLSARYLQRHQDARSVQPVIRQRL